VLQVHDELVYEVAQGRAEEGRALVKRVMEEVGKGLSVPLIVKVSRAAPTWGEI
jgi:DNA polymerase I-like protein with 3'-5' exonuclease and polymerase domains